MPRHLTNTNKWMNIWCKWSYLLFIKGVLWIQHLEHFLIQCVEKFIHNHQQVHSSTCIVIFQFVEQIRKNIRVLLIYESICPREHIVKFFLGFAQHALKEIWKIKKQKQREHISHLTIIPTKPAVKQTNKQKGNKRQHRNDLVVWWWHWHVNF